MCDPLQADLALCVSSKSFDQGNGYIDMAKYKWPVSEGSDFSCFWNEVCGENWKFLNNPETARKGMLGGIANNTGSGIIVVLYKQLLLDMLIKNNLIKNYDWFIITRCDQYHYLPHVLTSSLDDTNIYIPEGQDWGGICDRHALVPQKYVVQFLNQMRILNGDKRADFVDRFNHSQRNPEGYLKSLLETHALEDKVIRTKRTMCLVRGREDSTRWQEGRAYEKWIEEIGLYVKYRDEYKP